MKQHDELDIDAKEMYKCGGVVSNVPNSGRPEELHVTFIDAEKHSLNDILTYCYQHLGVFMVLESSKGNYHVYAPLARPKELVMYSLSNCYIEHQPHADIGYERGDWVLRITKKGIYASEPLAPKPELVEFQIEPKKKATYSKPHLEYMRHVIPSDYHYKLLEVEMFYETVGKSELPISVYETYQ